ncbi:MAG: hypothetical protein JWN70_615 [Planctomycetaceae bacterium]|nr:hypothetical protein [Planctomycetaceae bacterium]
MDNTVPNLITAGVIARKLGASLHRVQHILATRPHIHPTALAGRTRLYAKVAIAQVRYQLTVIDAKQSSRQGGPAHV